MPKSPLATLRRQQLSDIAVAFGLDVNPDATKDELLPVILAAESQGRFQRPAKDPYRLTKASKSPDEWRNFRDGGGVMPPFEDPEPPNDPNSFKMLQQRVKALGRAKLGQTKQEMLDILAEVEGK